MTTTPTVWRPLFQVNTTDDPPPGAHLNATNTQANSVVIALSGGRYLVAWEDSSSAFDFGLEPRAIVGQIFDALGNKIGGEIALSSAYSDLDQQAPAIAALPNGGFVAAYQTADAALFGDLENITVQVYDANGAFVRVDDFRQGAGGPLGINDTKPAITAFSDGSYAVYYETDASGNSDIVGHFVSAAGAIGAAFPVTSALGNETNVRAATLSTGNAVVVYQNDAGASNVLFSILTPSGGGVTQGAVAGSASAETAPAVAVLTSGFVVVWNDADSNGAGNAGIKFRLYSNAGVGQPPQSANITTTAGQQSGATVAALLDGGFVVAWADGPSATVKGQRFDALGNAVGAEVTLASGSNVSDPELTMLSDGRFIVTATNVEGGTDADVVSVIWDPRTSPINGSAGDDVLTSRLDGATVNGLGGSDLLLGQAGADTLDGGAGADTMQGGAGNDLYGVRDLTDVVDESIVGSSGTDTVNAVVTVSLADTVHFKGNIENVTLLGTANLNATGNGLANVLTGNSGANTLDGGAGADTARGLGGNDLYGVREITDVVDESVGGSSGIDRVNSLVNFSLVTVAGAALGKGAIEAVTLLGTANAFIYGNAFANVFIGNSGSNLLAAGAGNDTLTGAGGNDFFLFNTALNGTTNVDTITDMNEAGDDTIRLENAIFTVLTTPGALAAAAFVISTTGAVDADDRIIYNNVSGELFYDADGAGAGASTKFAILDTGLGLTSADFVVV